ncbi:TPA: hypothetical protein N2N50_003556 [Kluyvera ascorbata]|nr:hypothetical protein [Kluyvera ascorbata]HED3199970.1 hypothetical protein [Kluyvera ascorbata]HED4087238.1 hypothetical protein [Kluyvera ascorbata]
MTLNLTDPDNHPANGPLTVERIERVIEALQLSIQYQNGGDMAYVIADAIKGLEELQESRRDTKRLDWLDTQTKRLNEYYGTVYGWKFDANFQRNAMMLNDSNYPVMTVRQAIDEATEAAPTQENI